MNTVADLKRALSDEAVRLAPSGGLEDRVLRGLNVIPVRRNSRKRRTVSPRFVALIAALLTFAIVITLVFAARSLAPHASPVNVGRPGTALIEIAPRPSFFSPDDAIVIDISSNERDRLLITHDGGRSWFSTPIQDLFLVVWWIDREHIVIDPWPDRIETTSDGGAHWTALPFGGGPDPSAGFFLNLTEGWTIGNSSPDGTGDTVVYHTTDTGAQWDAISMVTPFPATATSIFFTDRLHGYMGGDSRDGVGRYFVTADGGKTWRLVQLPRPASGWGAANGVVSVPTFFGQRGVLFYSAPQGFWGLTSYVFSTSDGGASWSNPQPSTFLQSTPAFADPSHAWVVDLQGHEYRSDDGGETWTPIPYTLATGYVLATVAPVGGEVLWGTAHQPDLGQSFPVRSVDGGATWSFVKVPKA